MGDADRLARAVAAIDRANADDPNTIRVRGEERPKEQAHAELATRWVEELAPDAGDALRLAARAHHLRRWAIPRGDYPTGTRGYHAWRRALQELHARETGDILRDCGYDDDTVARVGDLIRKRGLGGDPEVQVLEDALCLVFLETQLGAVAEKLDEDHLVRVLVRTLAKMSEGAITRATVLDLDPAGRVLLERALQQQKERR